MDVLERLPNHLSCRIDGLQPHRRQPLARITNYSVRLEKLQYCAQIDRK